MSLYSGSNLTPSSFSSVRGSGVDGAIDSGVCGNGSIRGAGCPGVGITDGSEPVLIILGLIERQTSNFSLGALGGVVWGAVYPVTIVVVQALQCRVSPSTAWCCSQ